MRYVKTLFGSVLALALLLSPALLPWAVADPAVSIIPSTGVTDLPGFPMNDPEHNMYVGGWSTPSLDETYAVTFTGVANASKILVVLGDVQSVARSADDDTVVAQIKPINLFRADEDQSMVGLIAALGQGPSNPSDPGPPDEAKGMYISTNAYEWEIMPSDSDNDGKPRNFKIRLTGRTGTAGFFKWFWPQALLDLMDVNASNLAGFIDGNEVSMNATAVDGGALITIRTTYSTKVIKTGRALPISLAFKRSRVSRNDRVRLYGWISPKRANKPIAIYRRFIGETDFTNIGSLTTNSRGYFQTAIAATRTATYYASTQRGSRIINSPIKQLTIR